MARDLLLSNQMTRLWNQTRMIKIKLRTGDQKKKKKKKKKIIWSEEMKVVPMLIQLNKQPLFQE